MSENSDTDTELQAITQEGGTLIFPRGARYFADQRKVDLLFVDDDGDLFTQTGNEEWKVVGEPAPSKISLLPRSPSRE